ncbi:hypothetical protein [Erwinia pyrifoliae]|uniref:DUF3899 domain-containing protein n=1 Tax=Erwinia pyrifoliae TaxID=79967 RepID=A0ABY5XB77_ERWPY|nr:hypothetical protein [Erwinia pyrifoliae]MCT2386664.1 hypothetical protein [Erwinia pyrifoliae]MCU8587738.1 hypothetical protein [Erwinia pyrifoliae]UWS34660.1 hypothetical protein NYP84_05715 [Erwinia pyrifoliae]
MKSIIYYTGLAFAIVPFFILVIQFIIFSINTKKYNTLLSMYHSKEFKLPPLYQFYGSMGFFGSFGMAYFFSRIKKGKKIIFQPKEHLDISNFLRRIDMNLTKWIDTYYCMSIAAMILYMVFVVMTLIKMVVT